MREKINQNNNGKPTSLIIFIYIPYVDIPIISAIRDSKVKEDEGEEEEEEQEEEEEEEEEYEG